MSYLPILAILARVSDDVPTWPTKESALDDLRDRELQARIRSHYKYNDGKADAAQRFADSKGLALAEDEKRSWRRR